MKTTIIIASLILVTGLQQSIHAQTVTKYGDKVSTLNGIMKAYYDVVTVKKGGKVSYERESLVHRPDVSVGRAKLTESGKPAFHYMSLKEYHRLSDAYLEKDGFY